MAGELEGGGSWRWMPAAFVQAVGAAADRDAVLDAIAGLPAGKQRRLLHPSGGVAAILSTRQPGDRVLVVGSPHLTLATALGTFGAAVWSADWIDARLRCTALLTGAGSTRWLRVPPDGPLPFPAGCFDNVVLDLDDLGSAFPEGGAGRGIRAALAEAVRVLAADGSLTMATTNQLLRRPATPFGRARALRSPWCGDLLAAVGLGAQRVFVPVPNRRRWKWLVPLEALDADLLRRSTRRQSPAQRRLTAVAGRTGLARWLVPDFYVVAARGRTGRPLPTFVDALDARAGPSPTVASLTDARVGVIGPHRFWKVPLSPSQSKAIGDEVANTAAAARTAAWGRYVVAGRAVRDPTGAVVADYPLVVARPGEHPDAETTIANLLADVTVAGVDELARTGVWRRLASAHGGAECTASETNPLRAHVLDHLGTVVVPTGPTHGDLHAANLLHTADGLAVVDWNRFEACNPLVLDPLWSWVVHARARSGASLLRTLDAFIDGDGVGPLHDLALGVLGELTREQAAVLVLLDRITTYGDSRRRTRPWTLPGLRQAAVGLGARLAG